MKAFWISASNEIIPVTKHFEILLSPDELREASCDEIEKLLLSKMKGGWLRARRYRNHWSLQGRAWDAVGKAEAFKRAIVQSEPDQFVDLEICIIARTGRGFEDRFRTSLNKI